MLLFFPKTPSVALKKMHSPPPPLRSPPRGGQHFKPFNSRSCPCLGRLAESRAVKKSLTTALNHHTLPSAHTDNFKPSEAKKMHSPPPPLRSPPPRGAAPLNPSHAYIAPSAPLAPPEGGSTFKPLTRLHSPLRSARPPEGGSTFKPLTRLHSPLRSARPPEGGSTSSRSFIV